MLTRNWGWIALRGAVAILFGLLTIFRPGITLSVLIMLFGAYALIDGIFMVVSAIANRHGEPRSAVFLESRPGSPRSHGLGSRQSFCSR
jgi:uncharacterized membrane protein HdeD (DUF308 family)